MTKTHACRCNRCGVRLATDNHDGRCASCQAADRDRVAQAPVVPPEFWMDEGLQEALHARHMGRVIRAYRHHPYHGRTPLPQEIVAGWVGITQAHVSRIEHGGPIVHLDRLIHWAKVLGIPGQHLWFALPDSPRSEGEDVKRRRFLTTSAGLAGALAGSAMRARSLPTTDLAAAMLGGQPAASEPASVADLTRQVTTAWRLRQRASYEALGQLLPMLLTEAETRAHGGADDAEQAGRVVVHAYNATSSLLRKLGDGPLALVAADRAVRAARALDDPVLMAAALYRLANVLLSARRPEETTTVALQAADLIEPGKMQTPRSLATWGGLLLTAAVAAARGADESAAWELMGEARTAGRLLGTDYADIYSIFGPTNIAIHGVQIAVELHNGRDAIRRSTMVDPGRLPTSLIERRGQFLIDLAHGYVLEGDDRPAVAVLLQADHIAPQEVRLSPEVHGLTRVLLARERAGAIPGLRELAERIGLVE
jgi:transcriptional regulator with XRE-family HTH domain